MPAQILADLVEHTPGDEGKWFAAAKDAQLFDEAIALASRNFCSPQTLTRAARDFADKNPQFAFESGIAALRWVVEGYGYDITSGDVLDAFHHAMAAAGRAGTTDVTFQRIKDLVATETYGERFVTKVVGPALGLQSSRRK